LSCSGGTRRRSFWQHLSGSRTLSCSSTSSIRWSSNKRPAWTRPSISKVWSRLWATPFKLRSTCRSMSCACGTSHPINSSRCSVCYPRLI
jgi:hypothetical protein